MGKRCERKNGIGAISSNAIFNVIKKIEGSVSGGSLGLSSYGLFFTSPYPLSQTTGKDLFPRPCNKAP